MWLRWQSRMREIADDDGRSSWLRNAVLAVLLLNLADLIFTMWWVQTGVATEANVLLTGLVERNFVVFALAKTMLVSLGVLLLWRQRRRPLATFGIGVSFVAYNGLFLYHLGIAALAFDGMLA
ncbi:MAG TPA: DUF5658 family protein [Nannocystaceae bacterium]|nr:DUF5658 family protein [Nannocystaceae bacterium]